MTDPTVQQLTCARIPTPVGEFELCLYANSKDDKEHLALTMGDIEGPAPVLVRVHSECLTGDTLGSVRCDCGWQLRESMARIAEEGSGVIIYLRQEGRGIGLRDKLHAYNLQDAGYDTVEANLLLGHQADGRDYTLAARILEDLGVRDIRLITNNPRKIDSLDRLGIRVSARVPLQARVTAENRAYLAAKEARLHHMLDVESQPAGANGQHRPG